MSTLSYEEKYKILCIHLVKNDGHCAGNPLGETICAVCNHFRGRVSCSYDVAFKYAVDHLISIGCEEIVFEHLL